MTTLEQVGSVSLNYATKTVTGGALSGQLGTLFGESGSNQEGDVISFGVKTKGGILEMPLLLVLQAQHR